MVRNYEHEVGETFMFGDMVLRVEEAPECNDCYFSGCYFSGSVCMARPEHCAAAFRKDGKGIIFRKIEQNNEGREMEDACADCKTCKENHQQGCKESEEVQVKITSDSRSYDFAQILAHIDSYGGITIRTYGNPDMVKMLAERLKVMLEEQ